MKNQNVKVISLQKKLITTAMLSSIFAGLIALLSLMGFSIYQTMSMQDKIMGEISDMLLLTDLNHYSGEQLDELSEEFDIQYQLKLQQQILTQSTDFELTDVHKVQYLTDTHKYGFFWADSQLWRSYSAEKEHGKITTWVVQPLTQRFEHVWQSFLMYSGILIFLWLLQWLISHFLIQKQFRYFQLLSQEISAKNAHDLAPIQTLDVQFKELQPLLDQLNSLLQRLDQSLMAEQRFTADASHELRSPLSAIQMRLQVLKRKYQHFPELQPYLENIQQDVQRGTQVLENLLLLARLDPTQASQLPMETMNIRVIVEEVIQSFTLQIQQKKLQLDVQYQNIDRAVNAELFFIVIRNLMDNAIRYTPVGGYIHLQMKHDLKDQSFEMIIENSGEDLDEEMLSQLGQRFYRVLGTKTQGSGLGLSIVKKIIILHQGSLTFALSQWGGLKVVFKLNQENLIHKSLNKS